MKGGGADPRPSRIRVFKNVTDSAGDALTGNDDPDQDKEGKD